MRCLIFAVCFLAFCGCSPSSLEDFQKEGESLSRKIISDLQAIKTTQELVDKAPLLKKRFYSLVELMIEARRYQENNPEEGFQEQSIRSATFNELFIIELERIYQLERGREIVENVQRDALHRLHAFERGLKKRREKLLLKN